VSTALDVQAGEVVFELTEELQRLAFYEDRFLACTQLDRSIEWSWLRHGTRLELGEEDSEAILDPAFQNGPL
jgi:hypothetical protein